MEASGQLHAPAALPPGKERRHPLDRRLGGAQSHSGHGDEIFHAPEGTPTPIVQPVAQSQNSLTLGSFQQLIWDISHHGNLWFTYVRQSLCQLASR